MREMNPEAVSVFFVHSTHAWKKDSLEPRRTLARSLFQALCGAWTEHGNQACAVMTSRCLIGYSFRCEPCSSKTVEETNHWPFNNNQCLIPNPPPPPLFSPPRIIWCAVCVCTCIWYGVWCFLGVLCEPCFFLWGSLWLTPRPLFLWGQPAKNQATYQRVGGHSQATGFLAKSSQ